MCNLRHSRGWSTSVGETVEKSPRQPAVIQKTHTPCHPIHCWRLYRTTVVSIVYQSCHLPLECPQHNPWYNRLYKKSCWECRLPPHPKDEDSASNQVESPKDEKSSTLIPDRGSSHYHGQAHIDSLERKYNYTRQKQSTFYTYDNLERKERLLFTITGPWGGESLLL